ncbi:hypothetical protein [Pseudomonas protegens]|uniref:hypothetical protein n=1 Tax=Pseudomonas protegens TaxID=380021 RepID=UPI001A91E14C|nr:hypothetical protein [Pseudomonas protegens]
MDVMPTITELVDLFERRELASQMACRFKMSGRTDTHVIEEQCIALHNAGTIDLLALVEEGSLQELQGGAFFMASDFFCRLLPELDALPERMMRCVSELVNRGGRDGAANEPNTAFHNWCARDLQRATKIIASAHEGDETACRYLSFALDAISDLTETRRIAVEYDDTRRQAAIIALGRIKHTTSESCIETFKIFNILLDKGIDDSVNASILHALMKILACNLGSTTANADTLISRLVASPDHLTIHQCALVLWLYPQALTQEIVTLLANTLSHVDSTKKGTIDQLDLGLQSLLVHNYSESAISLVTLLLSRSNDNLELEALDSFMGTLLSDSSGILSRAVVQWLELGTPRLCRGLADAIQGPELDGVPLDLKAEDLAISSATQLFICRKAIGWFFYKPTTAASVLVSVLRVCDEMTAQEVQRLLIDPLLQNYGCIRKYLESISPEDVASKAVISALAQNEANIEAQRSVPLIVELQPSEHHRRIEHLRISDEMRNAHKEAENNSVFLNLVSRSVLLYGNRSVNFIDDGQDKLRPVEIELHSHGVSFEMPRMEVVDPVGLDYTLRVFRNERMKK